MLWQTTHPLDFPINPLVITTLYLVEVDEDGHPEITEATVLVPTWTDEQQSLIMQGYGMAMEHLGRFMDAEAETDHERVEGIYELLNDNERAFMNGDGWEHITSDLPWIE